MDKYFREGVIANTHGIRGEVKVYPTTDDIKRFKQITIEKLLLLKSSIKIEFLLTSKFSIAIIGYSVYIWES